MTAIMKAVGFRRSLPVDDPDSLVDFETAVPSPGPRDLLIKVAAASVNPADTKKRRRAAVDRELPEPMILGFDGVGTVAAVGPDVRLFAVGDRVWYAGNIMRAGSNAEYQLVDERIVGHAPRSLSDAEAAALPLTGLTAWEALFERISIPIAASSDSVLLIIGGAGGVGSIATQLVKRLTGMSVVATASRPETRDWCLRQGADVVADHYELVESVRQRGVDQVEFILNCADTAAHWEAMAELIAPEGRIASVVESHQHLDLTRLMLKSVVFAWENMSTRPLFNTSSMQRQHDILDRLAELVDSGKIASTLGTTLNGLSAANLREGHRRLEAGTMVGKVSIAY